MKIKILDEDRNVLKLQIEGEGHTFCNVVQKALLADERVDMAGYNIAHPLTSSPVIYIRTKGRSKPETVLRKAVKEVQEDVEAFRKALDKALKEWLDQNPAS
jgi:DNA-directed RNA polymerase subunit L